MRKTRDGASTKTDVINAARDVFAEHGFAGTSLAMISAKSGISDGLILHHFKSKQNLYHTVQEKLAEEYFAVITRAGAGAENAQQASLNVLRAVFRYWREDHTYNRISLWAYLEKQSELSDQEVKMTAGLAETVRAMQAQGQADDRFSPFALLTMIIGPLHFWMRYRKLFKHSLGLDASLEELDQDFEEQFIQMVMKLYQPVDAGQNGEQELS